MKTALKYLTFPAVILAFFLFTSWVTIVPTTQAAPKDRPHKKICDKQREGKFGCHAHVVTDEKGKPDVATSPAGYGPAQFLAAYHLASRSATPRTIAIVDAYDHPNALADLNTYSSTYNIATMSACLVSSGTDSSPCFQKADQNGGTSYPSTDPGWALEISLDVEAAHAICQNCN